MDNFDLRKYLAEGKLLKEEVDYSSIKGEMKKIYDIDVDLDTIKDFVTSYDDGEGMDIFDTTEREDFYLYLKDEGRLLKENIDFPELEDEFEGAMGAMVVEPEVYLQDIIDASAEEIVSDDYYEIMNAVEMGTYSAEEAVKLAKAWAKEKLSNLAEGKLLKEDNLKDYWSEWAAGEIKVGNDTVGVEFGDADDEAMGVFKDYVKAVKSLNADSKELRNDIAGAVSSILYDGGDFEDYSFDVLTTDQFTKIQDII